MALAESATDTHPSKKHHTVAAPPPPPSPSSHPAANPSSVKRQYRFLSFAPGTNYRDVNPTLLQKMNALGRTYGSIITIISGFRTHAEQRSLYAAYKNGTGNIAAAPGRSYHEQGLAVDALIDGQAIGDVLPQEAFAGVGLTNLKSIDDAPHVQLDEQPYSDDPSRIKFIRREAKKRGLDPDAVIAVASAEGLSGGVGDGGHAFGPFQLNDAGGVLTNAPAEHHNNEWAWSDEGIGFALDHIARVAGGLKGPQAIEAIVTRFERPQDPQSEIQRANAAYGSKISGSYTGGYTPTSAPGGLAAAPSGYSAVGTSIGSAAGGEYPLGKPTFAFNPDMRLDPSQVRDYRQGYGMEWALNPLAPLQAPYGRPPWELPNYQGLSADQVAQTWDMIAQQPGASPEAQSLARRMRLYLSDNAS